MNRRTILTSILAAALCFDASAQNEEIGRELMALANKVSVQINLQGKKKVAVVDFTDLQGASSELGRYVAEELTVNLVLEKREFSVLDRANLRRLLAEHKLTSQGLVDPENAKKIGKFAGVDVLVLGTIIPKGSNNIGLNAKVITTDTAEIIGAARAELTPDENVRNLLSAMIKGENALESGQAQPSEPIKKPFGDLQARVESFKVIIEGSYVIPILNIVVTNTSSTKTYGIALDASFYQRYLSNSRGDEFKGISVNIETATKNSPSWTEVLPRNATTIMTRGQVSLEKPGDLRPYRFQLDVFFAEEERGKYPKTRIHNLVLDIK